MTPKSLATLIRTISTERRLRLLRILIDSPEPLASSVLSRFLDIGDGPTSYNLMRMAEIGVVLRQQQGQWVLWTVNRALLREISLAFEPQKDSHNESL